MKILIGCDVDPILPPVLQRPPETDIWEPLDRIAKLAAETGENLPPITWLIRADESVRFCTGSYASGFTTRHKLWRDLTDRGHELGWHMHHLSWDGGRGSFRFDPDPSWLAAAHEGLAEQFPIRATRTGWDYGSTLLFNSLDRLGIQVDFSALPGKLGWYQAGPDRVTVDWLRCSTVPYHPDRTDYQQPGADALRMLEIPITQFPNSLPGMARRFAWRAANRCFSMAGLVTRTLLMTAHWPSTPDFQSDIAAFFFHPEELSETGVGHFIRNVKRLRELPGAEFVTASEVNQPGLILH
jgi:hypothetical protein